MEQHNAPHARTDSRLGRRTVLKGAAWSVPAVTLVATTAAAADSDVCASQIRGADTLKATVTGNKATSWSWQLFNDNAWDISDVSITFGLGTSGWSSVTPETLTVTTTIAANGSSAELTWETSKGNANNTQYGYVINVDYSCNGRAMSGVTFTVGSAKFGAQQTEGTWNRGGNTYTYSAPAAANQVQSETAGSDEVEAGSTTKAEEPAAQSDGSDTSPAPQEGPAEVPAPAGGMDNPVTDPIPEPAVTE